MCSPVLQLLILYDSSYQQVKGLNIWIHNAADWFQNVERHWARFLFVRYFLPFSFLVRDVQGKEAELEFNGHPHSCRMFLDSPKKNPPMTQQGPCQGTFAVCGQLLKDSWSLVAIIFQRKIKTAFSATQNLPSSSMWWCFHRPGSMSYKILPV